MIRKLRHLLQAKLHSHGIDIRKVPARFDHIPVFQLAVEALMARRGDALNFVQVGANDGMYGDPLRPYVLTRGWKGVLVEPQADVFEKLKTNYAACADRLVFENLAISTDDKLTLYLPPEGQEAWDKVYAESIVSSDPKIIAQQIGIDEGKLRRVDVPAITLDTLLANHSITELDLLQIDAEGYDWHILQTLNLKKVKPHLIQMETGHLDRKSLSLIADHLNSSGYLIHYGGRQGDTVAMQLDFFYPPIRT